MTPWKALKNNRRKNYFIERSFQSGFILKFCLLVVSGGLFTIGMLYFLGKDSTTVAVVNSSVVVKTTADFLLPLLIQTFAVTFILVGLATIIVTLFVSHKIAGPLYRLKKAMQELGEGNLSAEVKLRDSDALKDIAEAFNHMAKKVKEKLSR